MTEYLVIEKHPDFASASRRAMELAMRFQESTSVQRNQSVGWNVLGSSFMLTELAIEEVSRKDCIGYVYQDQEDRLDKIECEYFEEHESLIGWGSGDHDQLGEDTEDWSDSLDDSDSSYWENYLGGPDY